ncbi:MAG: bifunctional tetrahydrofolate synthase/dihydrofolate synthase [Sedimenticola sp.]|nr:bifunctional tetrahydrofolate synthase/dihydrofolate synthase [Sedimenticola sp.]
MRFNNLEDWLEWQSTLHPKEIELGLDRVHQVWESLASPSLNCKVITVAGTNGKGSCVAFLDAILRAASYRVGCYTSPHLIRYNERIVIDGEPASDERICQAFEAVDQARGEIPLTYFEFGTLAALYIFASAGLDVALLEVGLGGRLDAVNIIDPDVALISTVDIDHTDWLGSTREQIAIEKAGIMRAGKPAIFAGTDMPASLSQAAEEKDATLLVAGIDYTWRTQEQGWDWRHASHPRHSLPIPNMRGRFQLQNASAALMALECLRLELPLDQRAVRYGLQEAQLPGRYQVVGRDPVMILDVAHNAQAATALADNLGDMFCQGQTVAIFSMLADKQIAEVVKIMSPRIDQWYLYPINTPRAATLNELEGILEAQGIEADKRHRFESVRAALNSAQATTGEGDRVVVFGSFYAVGDVMSSIDK